MAYTNIIYSCIGIEIGFCAMGYFLDQDTNAHPSGTNRKKITLPTSTIMPCTEPC